MRIHNIHIYIYLYIYPPPPPQLVGESGSTVVEESQTVQDEVEFTEGLSIDRGFVSPYFVKDQVSVT